MEEWQNHNYHDAFFCSLWKSFINNHEIHVSCEEIKERNWELYATEIHAFLYTFVIHIYV